MAREQGAGAAVAGQGGQIGEEAAREQRRHPEGAADVAAGDQRRRDLKSTDAQGRPAAALPARLRNRRVPHGILWPDSPTRHGSRG